MRRLAPISAQLFGSPSSCKRRYKSTKASIRKCSWRATVVTWALHNRWRNSSRRSVVKFLFSFINSEFCFEFLSKCLNRTWKLLKKKGIAGSKKSCALGAPSPLTLISWGSYHAVISLLERHIAFGFLSITMCVGCFLSVFANNAEAPLREQWVMTWMDSVLLWSLFSRTGNLNH